MDGGKAGTVWKLFTNSVNFQDMRRTQVITWSRNCCPSQQDKTLELEELGHRMVSARRYRPGEEHALSCMETTAGGGGGVGWAHKLYSRPKCQESSNLTNL